MQRNMEMLTADLQLFADDAAAAPAAAPAEITAGTGSSHRSASGAQPQTQPSAAEDTTPPAAGEDTGDKRKAFRALIEGEYREQFGELFQNAFNRRFRDVKGMESRLAAQQPILELLARRYDVPAGDLPKLRAALEQDGDYWRAAAEKAGMSVEQYRELTRLREDSRQLQAIRRRQQADAQLRSWYRQAGEVKSRYPAFDLRAEMADGSFRNLLKSGVGVRQAYELRHMEEIKAAAARSAAQSAGEQMAARIRSRSLRPRENGISHQSAVVTKSGVHDLTPAERREIARRVQRGDRIRF